MPTLEPEARFRQAVAAYDDDPRVSAGTGFGGSPGRRVDGRIFAMLAHDTLVVKLPAARVTELISSGAGRPFDAGKGRPMREWVSVPPAEPDPWPGLASEAYAFVGGKRDR
jgi:hypothetical protein